MTEFAIDIRPGRVVFGRNTRSCIADEARRLGLKRVVVLAAGRHGDQPDEIASLLGPACAGTFVGARMHTPVEVTQDALAYVSACKADGLIAIGGGSAIGLSKALALRTDLPQIVLPVTYAGSEVTAVVGETRNGDKQTVTDARILPEVVIYDVELTLGVRPSVAILSGLNAMAHAIEALYAANRNPLTTTLGLRGIELMTDALKVIARDGRDIAAREQGQQAAWLCGLCLGTVGMSLHHKLCHVLGGLLDLPHAALHSALLPHTVAYNEVAVPELLAPVARIFGAERASRGLFDFAETLGVEMALGALGMPEAGIETALRAALANPYWNPRPLTEDGLRTLLQDALMGRRPE